VQVAPDTGHTQVDPEPGGDHLADGLPSSQRHREPVIPRVGVGNQVGQLAQFGVGELARSVGSQL